jgi:hypothetical protein
MCPLARNESRTKIEKSDRRCKWLWTMIFFTEIVYNIYYIVDFVIGYEINERCFEYIGDAPRALK